jgi:MFS family permease
MTRDFALVTSSMLIWGLGEGLFFYFHTIYLETRFHADPLAIGAILGSMGLLLLVVQAPSGYLSDRVGRRPVMWASWGLGLFSAWLMALANTLPVFVAGYLLYGLTAFGMAPMNSYLVQARGRMSVGRALTFAGAMYNLGTVIGPVVGGWMGQNYGLQRVYITGCCILVISTVLIIFIKPQPVERVPHLDGRVHLLRSRRFLGLLVLILFATFATYLPQPLTPNFMQNVRGLSLTEIGWLSTIGSLGNVIFMLAMGNVASGSGFILGQALVMVYTLVVWRGSGFPWFAAGYIFISGFRLCRIMGLALVRHEVHHAELGLAFGLFEMVNALTLMLAPLLAGVLYDRSPVLVYPVSLLIILASIIISLVLFNKKRGFAAQTVSE